MKTIADLMPEYGKTLPELSVTFENVEENSPRDIRVTARCAIGERTAASSCLVNTEPISFGINALLSIALEARLLDLVRLAKGAK